MKKFTAVAIFALMLGGLSSPSAFADEPSLPRACATDKLLPYPGHADKFIQCSNGIPYVMNCPEGLEFNYALQICDWPENVGAVTTSEAA